MISRDRDDHNPKTLDALTFLAWFGYGIAELDRMTPTQLMYLADDLRRSGTVK